MAQPGFHPPQPEEEALAIVPRGGGMDPDLLRVSVETARRYPRDEAAILKTLLRTISTFPTLAERFLYSIPYKDRGATVYVEGLTVRAAETLASAWGHTWVSATISGETDEYIDTQAMTFDAERNNVLRLPFRVSRFEKAREGGMRVLDDRRMLQVLQSGISKARRNSILGIIPIHIREAFEEAVREALAGGALSMPAEKSRVEACIESYKDRFSVTLEQLETRIGRAKQFWIGRDLSALRALFAALAENETTVAEAFPSEPVVVTASPLIPNGGTVVDAQSGFMGGGGPMQTANSLLEPPPPPAPKRGRPPKATPYVVKPPPVVATPPPEAGEPPTTLDAFIAECATEDALNALMSTIYAPDAGLSREEKRRVVALIGQRRAALQTPTA